MKTIEELYNEVTASEEMKKEFLSLKPQEVEGFAQKYGCKATLDEIKAYITKRNHTGDELSDDELSQVAGGKEKEAITDCNAQYGCNNCGVRERCIPYKEKKPVTHCFPPSPEHCDNCVSRDRCNLYKEKQNKLLEGVPLN